MGILLVDDNPDVQVLVELTLQKSGFSVISVNDGLSALDLAISDKPDLILVDCLVKGIDILTFVKKIQRRPALANTPIVLLQGEPDANPVALQLAAGHTILKKPLDPDLLSKEVKKQMGIVDEAVAIEEAPCDLSIPEDILSSEPIAFEESMETDSGSFNFSEPLVDATPDFPDVASLGLNAIENTSTGLGNVEKEAFKADINSEKVNEAIRKIVLEVVERVAWEIIPGLVETAMPKGKIQSLVEQAVWEIVPPLAEIEIKKEIKRLQPDEGFSS